jgi:hypothetical protein
MGGSPAGAAIREDSAPRGGEVVGEGAFVTQGLYRERGGAPIGAGDVIAYAGWKPP